MGGLIYAHNSSKVLDVIDAALRVAGQGFDKSAAGSCSVLFAQESQSQGTGGDRIKLKCSGPFFS